MRSRLIIAGMLFSLGLATFAAAQTPPTPAPTEASSSTKAATTLTTTDAKAAEAADLERLYAEEGSPQRRHGKPVADLRPHGGDAIGGLLVGPNLLLGKLLPRILQIEPPSAPRRLLKVVDRMAIDQKRSIMVIKLGNEYFLIGAAEQSISMMSKLDAEQVEQLLAEAEPSRPGLGRLGDLFTRRQAKGN